MSIIGSDLALRHESDCKISQDRINHIKDFLYKFSVPDSTIHVHMYPEPSYF